MSRFDTSIAHVTTDTASGLTWTRAYATEEEVNFEGAEVTVAALNEQAFGGFSDWRLPTVKELFGLVDHERFAPAIDTDAFETDGKYDCVWTSTPLASSPDYAWIVDFSYGTVDYSHRDDDYAFVRAVRAASPAGQ